jgi:Methyltransferase domain
MTICYLLPLGGTTMDIRSKRLKGLRHTAKHLLSPHLGFESGWRFGAAADWRTVGTPSASHRTDNPLMNYFVTHNTGPGIWKWLHYFDIYHRHLQKFRGKEVNILEIGIYSGGSLGMWRDYFGLGATIYGVDIEPACKAYANAWTRVFIGDQGDRRFWRAFKAEAPAVDVVIDDGGHRPNQQIVSLEELLPAMNPGGVYICEDIHGTRNKFASFVYGVADRLNGGIGSTDLDNPERRLSVEATGVQCVIESISLYPFIAVLARASGHVSEFVAPKHGTEWQPFLG